MSIAFRATLPKPTWQEAGKKVRAGFAALWPRSNRLAWIIVAVCAVLLALLILATGFDRPPPTVAVRILVVSSLAALLAGAGWPRAALMLESIALALGTMLVVPGLTSICAAMALPLQDDALAAIDRWMGIDWPAIAFWFRAHPEISRLMCDVYASIYWQPLALIGLLSFAEPERLRRMMTASAITLAMTIIGFWLIPALGPYWHFHFTQADFPDMLNIAPWKVPEIIEGLRNGSREIASEGLVTFPSYHAATAILFAFGWIGVPIIGVPCVILNLVMLVSAVPIGSHYIIDIFAGIAIALVSIRLADVYFRTADRLPPLETWDQTPEGRSILAVVGGWPILGPLLRRPLNASPGEQAAVT
jgi:membrane-associated phospholipid phosphatase